MGKKLQVSAFSIVAIVTILISILSFVGSLQFGAAQGSSSFGGVISSDTTWTAATGLYSLSGPITVVSGVTLTIEAGVTVNLNDYNIQVDGILYARGSIAENILFSSDPSGNGNIAFAASSVSWNGQTGTGCIIENAVLDAVSISINGASPKLNNNSITAPALALDQAAISTDGGTPTISNNIIVGDIENLNNASPLIINNTLSGGIFGMGMLTSKPIITNNNIKGGSAHSYGVGIRCDGSNVYVADNTISNCSTGIEVYDGTSVIERNLVFNNSYGIAITAQMSPIATTIRNNTIINNNVGISNNDNFAFLTINYNNIQNNSEINLHSVNATSNWWGTSDEQTIRQMLTDSVNFIPFLNESNPTAFPIPYAESTPTQNPATTPTQISIFVDASSAVVGETVYVTGKLTDLNGTSLQGKSIVLSYAVEGNTSWIPIGSDTTDAQGEYNIQWVNAASGTFVLKTEWTGNIDYQQTINTATLSFVPYANKNVFFVESNSTVSSLAFNSTSSELSFTISGTSGTTGYVKATIAKSILSNGENIKVYLDGNQLEYVVTSNPDSWLLTFNYHHSTHQVKINLATNASNPTISGADYLIWIVAAIAVALVCAVSFVVWRKRKKQP